MRPSPFTQLFEAVPIIHELSEKIGTSYKGQYAAISLLVCTYMWWYIECSSTSS